MDTVLDILLGWALPSLCAAVAGFAAGQVRRLHRDDKAVKMGVQALLRDRLYWNHDHYMQKGEYPIYARENVEEMYRWYHALGGNGTVTNLVRELDALPTKKAAQ